MRKSVALLTSAIVLKIALLFVFDDKNDNNKNNVEDDAVLATITITKENRLRIEFSPEYVHLHG